MLWREDNVEAPAAVVGEMVDIAFRITCRCLPVEHAHPLSRAVLAALPWLAEEADAGIHTIHVAESGHGWVRPDADGGELLHLSRRTPLVLRVPYARADDARNLAGKTLSVAGHALEVGAARERPLGPADTLFARYVVCPARNEEEEFVAYLAEQLAAMEIEVRKLLCGRRNPIQTPDGRIETRSVMVAELAPEESLRLQQKGIGTGRKLGCGLFIPHKGVGPVKQSN